MLPVGRSSHKTPSQKQNVTVTPISVVHGQEDVQEYGSLVCGITYLSCYHSSGAARSSTAVMKGRGVDSETGSCANNFNSTGSVYTNLCLLRTI